MSFRKPAAVTHQQSPVAAESLLATHGVVKADDRPRTPASTSGSDYLRKLFSFSTLTRLFFTPKVPSDTIQQKIVQDAQEHGFEQPDNEEHTSVVYLTNPYRQFLEALQVFTLASPMALLGVLLFFCKSQRVTALHFSFLHFLVDR